MSKGYLVMAQGPQYARLAEHLASSILSTQLISKISVITDEKVEEHLFDKVINVGEDYAVNSNWKIENRVKFYQYSPYDETVILDADMLFLNDVSHWWSLFEKYELLLTNRVTTYRGTEIKNSFYRKAFIKHDLPDIYSAFTYFKKTDKVKEFFNLVKVIVLNWKTFCDHYTPYHAQKNPSIDLAMSIAVKILGIEHEVTSNLDYPTFTHMKGKCQDVNSPIEDWKNLLGVHYTNNGVRIGPFKQQGILHYVNKDFV